MHSVGAVLWAVYQFGTSMLATFWVLDRFFIKKGATALLAQAKRERLECEDLLKKCEATLNSNRQLLRVERKWVS